MTHLTLGWGGRGHAKRLTALGLTAAMLFPPVSGLVPAAWAQQRAAAQPAVAPAPLTPPLAIKSILLFPFANNAGTAGDPVAARVADAIKLRLNAVGAFTATTYTPLLAPVQRAVADNVLSRDDITAPGTDKTRANRVAQQVSTDGFLTGAVESYTADPTTRRVSLEVSAVLYDTATGTALRTLAFSAAAVPTSPIEDQSSVVQSAVDDVSSRIAQALNSSASRATAAPVQSSQRGKVNPAEPILLTLLAGALIYAAFHHSGGGDNNNNNSSNSGSSGPPAPPGGGTTGTGGPPGPPVTSSR